MDQREDSLDVVLDKNVFGTTALDHIICPIGTAFIFFVN
jgi:hypothetical protein